MIVEHTGATEDYAALLAGMRRDISEIAEASDTHVDGGGCDFEVTVVWRCGLCGREQHQPM